MRVNLVIESTDGEGTKSRSENTALMYKHNDGYRLTYSEDLSGEGEITKTTMYINTSELRIIRRGELTTDFIYSESVTHNTAYETPFGNLPITLITEKYECIDNFLEDELGELTINSSYLLDVGDALTPPTSMNMFIRVTQKKDANNTQDND
ncbi:MAG: DUF1934 domain-containing protein [Lachnospiraceae bacterium]|nr:DUF1934 domain-containing protein [Lachnospiraceae bacterium]